MTSSSPPFISIWKRSRSAALGQALASGLAFVLAVAAEFGRAVAATHRYEQLRRTCGDPELAARRIYIEFFSDE